MKISASLLSCDILNLENEIKILETAGAWCLHIDVMDGKFVPNIAFGIDFINRISEISNIPVNVHLMIENPEMFIDVISHSKINLVIIHIETGRNLEKIIAKIKARGCGVGLAINPLTNVSHLSRFINMIDLIMVMGVHPGFGGQTLLPVTIDRLKSIRGMIGKNQCLIAVDGGVNEKTAGILKDAGADILVVGSYLFDNTNKSDDHNKIHFMKEKIEALCVSGRKE